MKFLDGTKLDFSDVLIVPQRSEIGSRSDVNLERDFVFRHSKRIWKGIPIIASNMDSIGTFEMYQVLSKYKMITCFHKFYEPEDYALDMDPNYYMISTGVNDNDWEKLQKIITRLNPYFVCIDVANGYSYKLINFVKKVRKQYPDMTLIAGNVVTSDMSQELIYNGVDIVKVGIGSGSCCLTRKVTGCGFPQLSAIQECGNTSHGSDALIISDGGIQNPGDFSKAFGAGADFVMAGSIFSGHDENSGEVIEENGKKYKIFYGMSSKKAMEKHYGKMESYRSSEGNVVKVPYKGSVEETVKHILGGIRSCMSYIGAKKLKNFSKCCTFIRVNNQLNTIYSHPEYSVSQ